MEDEAHAHARTNIEQYMLGSAGWGGAGEDTQTPKDGRDMKKAGREGSKEHEEGRKELEK